MHADLLQLDSQRTTYLILISLLAMSLAIGFAFAQNGEAPAAEPAPAEPAPAEPAPVQTVSQPQCAPGETFVDGRCQFAGFEGLGGEEPPPASIPSNEIECPDGSRLTCSTDPTAGRVCPSCPVSQSDLPPGCREEREVSTGFSRVVCEHREGSQCPPPPQQDAFDRCREGGGVPSTNKDASGCQFFDCRFEGSRGVSLGQGEEEEGGGFISLFGGIAPGGERNVLCLGEEEYASKKVEIFDVCKGLGQPVVTAFENGCPVPACGQKSRREERPRCPNYGQMVSRCESQGLDHEVKFDGAGCKIAYCIGEEEARRARERRFEDCQRTLPPEAYEQAAKRRNELVVHHNKETGCVENVFEVPSGRVDRRAAEVVDPIEEIPDTGRLLQLALDLDGVLQGIDDAVDRIKDVAAFWEKKGKPSERYDRAVFKLRKAAAAIEEAKAILRELVENDAVNEIDLLEVRKKIREAKEVHMKEALLFLLASDGNAVIEEEFEFEEEDIEKGRFRKVRDMEEFGEAFAECKAGTHFEPGVVDAGAPAIDILGIEGEACKFKATFESAAQMGGPGGEGPPDFVLKFMGIDPDDKIEGTWAVPFEAFLSLGEGPPPAKYCVDGNMCKMIQAFEKFGGGPPQEFAERGGRGGRGRGGPGGSRGPGGPGEFERGPPQGFREFEGPGGCSGPRGCREYCADHFEECQDFGRQRGPPQRGFDNDRFERFQREKPETFDEFRRGPPPGGFRGGPGEFGEEFPQFPGGEFPGGIDEFEKRAEGFGGFEGFEGKGFPPPPRGFPGGSGGPGGGEFRGFEGGGFSGPGGGGFEGEFREGSSSGKG